MNRPTQPRMHHYVPQFHLKRWGAGKKNRLHVFDKASRRSWPAKPKDAARERDFYMFDVDRERVDFEASLERVESASAPVIQKLISASSVGMLSEADRATLCVFLALQFVRTPAARQMTREAIASMQDEIIHRCVPPGVSEEERFAAVREAFGEADDDSNELFDLEHAPRSYAAAFSNNKDWFLLRTQAKLPFLIGDHPVVMQNSTAPDHPIFGNIGLACRGIEIYFPLSPTLTLAMFCTSHLDAILEATAPRILLAERLQRDKHALLDPHTRAFLSAAETGLPIDCAAANVENLNFLQIAHAERHVFSARSDWALVNRVLDADPRYVRGRRLRVR